MQESFSIIPTPKQLEIHNGLCKFDQIGLMTTPVPKWTPILHQLRLDLALLYSGRLVTNCEIFSSPTGEIATEEGRSLALVIKNNTNLKSEVYTLKVDANKNFLTIEVGDELGLHHAIATTLQLIEPTGSEGLYSLPVVSITDEPHAEFRGLLVDVARKKHTLETLQRLIMICYWNKLNYFHVHFTDKQSYTLPSLHFPELPSKGRHFTIEEIHTLNRFAQERGITIIPEIDLPGHARSMINSMPELFAVETEKGRGHIINIGKEEVYDAIDLLLDDLCKFFPETPYIHFGADEIRLENADQDPYIQAYMKKHNLANIHEVFRHFIVRINEKVKARGKQLCIWEGFGPDGDVEIPKDILIFEFESLYNTPDNLLKEGYTLVNTSWKPIYVVPRKSWNPAEIYQWNMYRWENWVKTSPATENPYQFEPTDQIIGAQMCSWEQKDKHQYERLIHRIPPFAENVWNNAKAIQPHNKVTANQTATFLLHMEKSNEKLKRLIKGRIDPQKDSGFSLFG